MAWKKPSEELSKFLDGQEANQKTLALGRMNLSLSSTLRSGSLTGLARQIYRGLRRLTGNLMEISGFEKTFGSIWFFGEDTWRSPYIYERAYL
ncbi:MAG: hypothetical protein O8C58_03415 [Candidatus Methanoperedens sp.]|nr:hypothetical protein [Candidatus Methanoperedens sp.]